MSLGAWRRAAAPIAGGCFGALFFVWISGTRVLNPTEFTWLMKMDWRIHFLGWHFYRTEPWHWPPGRLESFFAPVGTAIGFTDSIPVMAFALKPFSAMLSMPFQYIGIWLLICFALQGVFGVLLMRVWTSRIALQLLGGALFVLMPLLLNRLIHPALCSHFLILCGLWFYFRNQPARISQQAILGLLAGLIHPYLAVMTLGILGAAAVRDRTRSSVIGVAAAALAVVSGWWASGLFTVRGAENLAADGLHYYSVNLLGVVTPTGWSALLPDVPVATDGQLFEGFAYLGAGILALIACALTFVDGVRRVSWRLFVPVTVVCLLFATYALSPRVTLGGTVVFDWSTDWLGRWSFFRATARFFWPMAYLIVTFALATMVSRTTTATAITLLAGAIALQMVDLHGVYRQQRALSRSAEFHAWANPLPSPAWHHVLPHYDHLVLVPSHQCGSAPIGFESPAFLAGLHGLTINSVEVARLDQTERGRYCERLETEIASGILDDRSLYILDEAHEAMLSDVAHQRVVCGPLDAIRLCVTATSYERWRSVVRLN